MKITGIETHIAGNPWKNWLFVVVRTDEGIHGVGEGTINGFTKTTAAAVEDLSHLVVGQDPRQIEHLVLTMKRDYYNDAGMAQSAACAAIEMACLDITGKSLGVPVWQLLGGQVRSKIRCYANGWYRCERTPEAFAAAAQATVADGYTALKFDPFGEAHLHTSLIEENIAIDIVRAVRAAVGPSVELMIEGHCRFAVGQAVKIAHRLSASNISWFEEPCPPQRIEDTITVAQQVPVPISSGESLVSKEAFATLCAHGAVAVYQPEIMALGGISVARHVCAMVESFSGVVAPHNAQGPISTVACLHLAASCSNYLIQEYFDHYNVEWEKDLTTWQPKFDPTDGCLEIPTAPGLGVDLNLEEIAKHPYQSGNYLPLFNNDWHKREGKK